MVRMTTGSTAGPSPAATASTAARAPLNRVEQELRVVLRRAAAAQSELARRIHPDLDASAYPLLAIISAEPGVHATELARRFGIGRATISRQLSRLDELGLIHRAVDPEDNRGQLLTATESGHAHVEAARTARLDYLGKVFADWPDDDVSALADLLARYSASVDEVRGRAD